MRKEGMRSALPLFETFQNIIHHRIRCVSVVVILHHFHECFPLFFIIFLREFQNILDHLFIGEGGRSRKVFQVQIIPLVPFHLFIVLCIQKREPSQLNIVEAAGGVIGDHRVPGGQELLCIVKGRGVEDPVRVTDVKIRRIYVGMHADQHGPVPAETFFKSGKTALKIQMIDMELPVLPPGGDIENETGILRKLITAADPLPNWRDVLKIEVIFGKAFLQDRSVVPEAAPEAFGPEAAVAQQQIDMPGIPFGILDILRAQSGAGIPFDALQSGACMPGVDVGLIFFLFNDLPMENEINRKGA